jgi:hypothetical protein
MENVGHSVQTSTQRHLLDLLPEPQPHSYDENFFKSSLCTSSMPCACDYAHSPDELLPWEASHTFKKIECSAGAHCSKIHICPDLHPGEILKIGTWCDERVSESHQPLIGLTHRFWRLPEKDKDIEEGTKTPEPSDRKQCPWEYLPSSTKRVDEYQRELREFVWKAAD